MRNAFWFYLSLMTTLSVLALFFQPKKEDKRLIFVRPAFCRDFPVVVHSEQTMTVEETMNIIRYIDEECLQQISGCGIKAWVYNSGIIDFVCTDSMKYQTEDK